MSMVLSMAAFALVTSISPGPVNVVALGNGARHGIGASMAHVTGATVGFTLLLLLTGLGLHETLVRMPWLSAAIRWAGLAFLLYMASRLAMDSGDLGCGHASKPSMAHGAAMQWLNPKAWLAAVAGMGSYASTGNPTTVWVFAGVYFIVCYLSIASWALTGSLFSHHVRSPHRVRLFNRAMAALLVLSVMYLVAG